MLSDLQKLAFSLHSRLFFYVCPLPFNWNEEQIALVISGSRVKWIMWFPLVLNVLLHLILHVFCAVIYGWLAPRPDFTWLNTFISLIGVFVLSAYLVVAITFLWQRRVTLSAFNTLLEISQTLLKLSKTQKFKSNCDCQNGSGNIFDIAICELVIFGATAPFAMTFASLYTGCDALNFILADIIPLPKMYWSGKMIYWVAIARALSVFVT